MQDIIITVILGLIIAAQIYFIYYHNPEIYEHYYPVLIIIPAVIAAYLLVIYSKRKIEHISKPNVLLTKNQFENMKKYQTQKALAKLLSSQEFKKYQRKKQSFQNGDPEKQNSEEQIKMEKQFIQELEQKESQIFGN